MSHVADVLVKFDILEKGEQTHPVLEALNTWLRDHEKGELADLSLHFGGRKASQINLYGGAFSYLDIEGFLHVVRSQPWRHPEHVRVWIQDEHDENFTEYQIS